MSVLHVVQQLRAASDGYASERTTKLHRHIAAEPLVVVAYRLAGESAAPLGLMYGTRKTKPKLLVAPEPRSREIRFREVFNPFAVDLNDYISKCASARSSVKQRLICEDAPQIVVANSASAEFIGPTLGRSLRYLRSDGEYPVPAPTALAGAHLTWLGQQAELPGSCVLLAATELLRRHVICGLSDLESEDLHVHLAWVDPPAGMSGGKHAAIVEEHRLSGDIPAAGPTPDADWDRKVLAPLIEEFNEKRARADDAATVKKHGTAIRTAVHDALTPTWDATWQAIAALRKLPVADSVSSRWLVDRTDFTTHADRVESGEARFRTRDSVKQAAVAVSRRESAQSSLDTAEALDDPLVLAAAIADGIAISGTVTAVDRPTVELELSAPCPIPIGTELYWTEQRGKCSVIVRAASSSAPFTVTLTTMKGKTKFYPAVGERAGYAPFTENTFLSPKMPSEVPWTHTGAEASAPQPEVPE